jgi:transcriptional regulator with XRE-family HTH domain
MNDQLLRARLRAQLTQVELAERAGLAPQAVSNYENGRFTPRALTLSRLAIAMGLDPLYFLDLESEGTDTT